MYRAMNRLTASFVLLLLLAGGVDAGNPDADRARAATALDAFAGQLKAALVATMSSAGPVAAIEVCRDRAPAIAADVSAEYGFSVGRVTDRTRNPANAANAWQAEVLAGWAAQQAAGVDLAQADYFAELPAGGFRYMQPIVVQPPCLACHGSSLAPAVRDAVSQSYPDDHATGYAVGDLRGAFVAQQ
jgi:hypothetical protein